MTKKMRYIWYKLSRLGVTDNLPLSQRKKIILTNQFSFMAVILFCAIILGIAYAGTVHDLRPHIASVFIFALVPYLNHRGYINFTSVFLSLSIPILIFIIATISKLNMVSVPIGAYLSPRLGIIGSVIAPLILIDHKKKKAIILTLLINFICLLIFDPVHEILGIGYANSAENVEQYEMFTSMSYISYFFILGGTFFLQSITERYEKQVIEFANDLQAKNKALNEHKEEIEQQNHNLQLAYNTIDDKRRKITDSFHYARRIQGAVSPKAELLNVFFKGFFILNKPKDIVSGDFHWIYKQEDTIYFAVADCTGHGVPGALMSILGTTALNEIVTSHGGSPADVLNRLRERVKQELGQTGKKGEAKDGMDIALCKFDSKSKLLEFSGANNPLFVVNSSELTVLKPTRNPIGVYVKEKPFAHRSIPLEGGEKLYLFSDGYADQFGGEFGDKFSIKRFKHEIEKLQTFDMPTQKQLLEEMLNAWKQNREQVDDILVMGIEV